MDDSYIACEKITPIDLSTDHVNEIVYKQGIFMET